MAKDQSTKKLKDEEVKTDTKERKEERRERRGRDKYIYLEM
jgi:hypothetical protein